MISIDNVITNKQRIKLLNVLKQKLTVMSEVRDKKLVLFPGLQTEGDLDKIKEMQPLLNALKKRLGYNKILSCWGNHTDGSYINWHKHTRKHQGIDENKQEAIVYYLLNPDELGTMFRDHTIPDYDKIYYTKAKENSAIKFNASQIHSVPNSAKKINRISIALDVI
jgi:hypothetical protein